MMWEGESEVIMEEFFMKCKNVQLIQNCYLLESKQNVRFFLRVVGKSFLVLGVYGYSYVLKIWFLEMELNIFSSSIIRQVYWYDFFVYEKLREFFF